jgi:hypothetical protein
MQLIGMPEEVDQDYSSETMVTKVSILLNSIVNASSPRPPSQKINDK